MRPRVASVALALCALLGLPVASAAESGRPDQTTNTAYPFGQQAAGSPHCDPDLCIHWSRSSKHRPPAVDADADGIPDYVELTRAAAARALATQVGLLGWRPPLPDSEGGDSRIDIYLYDHAFGYGVTEWDPGSNKRRRPTFIVLENDFADGAPVPPERMVESVVAHEINHVLQSVIDARKERGMAEAVATWTADRVFPGIDDYLADHRGAIATYGRMPLNEHEYSGAVWLQWLAGRYGEGIVLDSWLAGNRQRLPPGAVPPGTDPRSVIDGYALADYHDSIRDSGGRSFAREFAAFAAAAAEWRTSGEIADAASLPDLRRDGRLGRRTTKLKLDHATFAAFKVPVRGASKLRLKARVGKARSAVALVGRSGGAVTGSTATTLEYLRRGGRARVTLRKPARFDRVTAILVNADHRRRSLFDYKRDRTSFRARIKAVR